MKTLLLMRHGKSSWKDFKKDEDKFRPLTKRGVKDVEQMADLLEEKEIFPQIILTSTAKRARETANIFLEECRGEITFIALDSLFLAEPPAVIEVLKTIQNQTERLLLIGHNPGLECLLQHLTGAVESLSTSNVACLELPIEHWEDISLETHAEKWEKWKPKDL